MPKRIYKKLNTEEIAERLNLLQDELYKEMRQQEDAMLKRYKRMSGEINQLWNQIERVIEQEKN
jgi:hypothetical protein